MVLNFVIHKITVPNEFGYLVTDNFLVIEKKKNLFRYRKINLFLLLILTVRVCKNLDINSNEKYFRPELNVFPEDRSNFIAVKVNLKFVASINYYLNIGFLF